MKTLQLTSDILVIDPVRILRDEETQLRSIKNHEF